MMQEPLATLTPETLRQHQRFLHRLVQNLVRDPHAAEDLAQEVWVAACRHRVAAWRPWLRKVARSLAIRRASRESTGRECEADHTTSTPSTADAIIRVETEQRVVTEMLALAEPYRSTVVLRFYEDLPPRRIAQRMGVPVETVRTRLRRALEQMRAALDAEYGDRRVWVLPVIGAGELLPAPLVGSLLGVTMKTKLAVITAGLAATLGLAWFALDESTPSVDEANDGHTRPAATSIATTDGAAPGTRRNDARPSVPSPDEVRRDLVAATKPQVTMTGRCVVVGAGGHARPIAGIRVTLIPHQRLRLSPRDEVSKFIAPEPVTTSTDGVFVLGCDTATCAARLKLDGAGIVPLGSGYSELRARAIDYGDIEVMIGCNVRGRLCDEKGRPLSGRRVRVGKWLVPFDGSSGAFLRQPGRRANDPMQQLSQTSQFGAETLADGTFSFATPLPAGTWAVDIHSRRRLVPEQKLTIDVGVREKSLDLVAETPTRTVVGRVTFDREGLKRMPRLAVRLSDGKHWDFEVDPSGEFTIEGFPRDPSGPIALEANARYHDRARGEFRWGKRNVLLPLRPLAALRVHVKAQATGEDVVEYGLRVFPTPGPGARLTANHCVLRHLGEHPLGRCRYPGLRSGPHLITVEPVRDDLAPSWFISCEVQGDGRDEITIELARMVQRDVVLTRVDQAPIGNAMVELLLPLGDSPVGVTTRRVGQKYMDGFRLDRALLINEWVSTAGGRLTLRSGPGERYALRITGDGLEPMVVHRVEVRAGMEPLRLELRRGAVVRGSIRNLLPEESGRPRILLVDAHDADHAYPRDDAQGMPLTADGRFEFTGLPPGSFRVLVRMPRRYPPILLGVVDDLAVGSIRELKLDGRALHKAKLRGRVMVDGTPVQGDVRLIGTAEKNGFRNYCGPVKSDAQGNFVIAGEAGDYRLSFKLALEGSQKFAKFLSKATVKIRVAEESTGQFRLITRKFTARLLHADGNPAARRSVSILWRGHRYPDGKLETDADGRILMSHAPEGSFTVAVWPIHLTDRDAQRIHCNEHRDNWQDVLIKLGPMQATGDESHDLRLPR